MNFELFPVVLFATVFPIVIGLLLRLPRLIIEIKENRKWTFDWIKLIAVGLPTLTILSMSIIPFSSLGESFIKIPEIIMVGSPTIQIIAGVVFGYILLDSLKK
jgi:hypothetical protein